MTTPSESEPASPGIRGTVAWLALGAAGVTLLAIIAAHAPERIKLFGLFPAAVGCLAGWGLGRLARELHVPLSRVLIALAWCLVAGGQIAGSGLAHRRWAERIGKTIQTDPLSEFSRQILATEGADDDPETRALREQLRENHRRGEQLRRERIGFPRFLRDRLSKSILENLPDPFPALLWGGEVLLAATAGAWVALLTSRPQRST